MRVMCNEEAITTELRDLHNLDQQSPNKEHLLMSERMQDNNYEEYCS